MDTISKYERPAFDRGIHRILRCALAGLCLAAFAGSATAQSPGALRLWAAQTGVDQVSLSWDSVAGTKEYRIYLGDPTVPGTLNKRPASVLSASGRGGILTGVQR